LRETGRRLTTAKAASLPQLHQEAFVSQVCLVRALPGVAELWACLPRAGLPWAINTSARLDNAHPALSLPSLTGNVVFPEVPAP
jgi:hypothetical protein